VTGNICEMRSIYFYSTGKIKDADLIEVFCPMEPFKKVNETPDFYALEDEEFNPDNFLYVELTDTGGQFKHHYRIFLPAHLIPFWREKVNLLIDLAKRSEFDLLTDDEGVNPYMFIHITADGNAFAVGVIADDFNERDELTIEAFYPNSPGSFATAQPLRETELDELQIRWSEFLSISGFRKIGPEFYFESFRGQFPLLEKFNNYYVILPQDDSRWMSKGERSQLLVEVMLRFAEQSGVDVCLFPANSTTVENIPGGSDSEYSCIVVVNGLTERIIFKPRRKSW
jgi:hypothetical protein